MMVWSQTSTYITRDTCCWRTRPAYRHELNLLCLLVPSLSSRSPVFCLSMDEFDCWFIASLLLLPEVPHVDNCILLQLAGFTKDGVWGKDPAARNLSFAVVKSFQGTTALVLCVYAPDDMTQ